MDEYRSRTIEEDGKCEGPVLIECIIPAHKGIMRNVGSLKGN